LAVHYEVLVSIYNDDDNNKNNQLQLYEKSDRISTSTDSSMPTMSNHICGGGGSFSDDTAAASSTSDSETIIRCGYLNTSLKPTTGTSNNGTNETWFIKVYFYFRSLSLIVLIFHFFSLKWFHQFFQTLVTKVLLDDVLVVECYTFVLAFLLVSPCNKNCALPLFPTMMMIKSFALVITRPPLDM
jgi:hypothetical protein